MKTTGAKEEYTEAKNEAKRVVRKAQNKEWSELGKALQEDFNRSQKRFWITVKGQNKGSTDGKKVCEENGDAIGEEERVVERWKEYFEGLLKGDSQQQDDYPQQRGVSQQEEIEEQSNITVEEVEAAIGKMKSGKVAGLCGINAEMLKAGDSVVVKWLHRIVNIAWATGEVPEDWKRAVIIPLHKKGSKAMCSNYRGISLLSVPGKVYARIVDNRVKQKTEGMILEVQGGFRKGRSCIDQIFTVRQLVEKVLEKGKQMAVACVDLEKAYDTVRRDKLWQVSEEYGIHGRLLGAVRAFHKKSEACVKIGDKMSRWFQITRGVRQGCVMSPWLFNVFMDKIVREAQERFTEGVQLETTTVKLVLFADDVMMLAEKSEDMERNLTEMKKAMDNWGMKIHWERQR